MLLLQLRNLLKHRQHRQHRAKLHGKLEDNSSVEALRVNLDFSFVVLDQFFGHCEAHSNPIAVHGRCPSEMTQHLETTFQLIWIHALP